MRSGSSAGRHRLEYRVAVRRLDAFQEVDQVRADRLVLVDPNDPVGVPALQVDPDPEFVPRPDVGFRGPGVDLLGAGVHQAPWYAFGDGAAESHGVERRPHPSPSDSDTGGEAGRPLQGILPVGVVALLALPELVDYLRQYVDNLVVALLAEDAEALDDDYQRISRI